MTRPVWLLPYAEALYRLERYQEAEVELTRLRELHQEAQPGQPHPVVTTFLSMIYHRLNQPEKAKVELARQRRELQEYFGTQQLEETILSNYMQAFYAEPAALIEGKK